MSERGPVVEFDHHSATFNRDPREALNTLREKCPVAWTSAHGGYWIVTGGDEVADVQKRADCFSSARSEYGGFGSPTLIPKTPTPVASIPIELDPPTHTRYRKILNVIVSPKAADEIRPLVRQWVDYFIDQFIEVGSCDLVYDLASPVPSASTLQWLGWPTDEWSRIAHLTHDLFGQPPGSERFLAAVEEARWLDKRLDEIVSEHREGPRDDIISYMLEQIIDGEVIDDETAAGFIRTLVYGGVDTTTALTSQTLVHLHRRPDHRQSLIEHPELLTTATEEFLRVYPPVASSARTVVKPTSVGGCPMEVGDRVLFMRWSANLDPERFPDPEDVQLDREPNRHMSFGLGPHRCAGSHVARVMFQEMLTQVLQRIPNYEVDEDRLIPYPDQGNFTGWTLVPATFTPGPRVLPTANGGT